MRQIASFEPIFSKKLQLLRGTSPLRHPPASCNRDGRRWRAILDFKKIWPLHFEKRSDAYAFTFIFSEGFEQTSHAHSIHEQQAQAAAMEELHTRMETLQQTSVQGNQNVQQTIQDLGLQLKQGKPV